MAKICLTLYTNRITCHISQIISALKLVKRKRDFEYKIILNDSPIKLPCDNIALIIVDGKKIGIDVLDGLNFNKQLVEEFISKIDFYFKRSCPINPQSFFSINASKKIFPLGFNYHIDPNNSLKYSNNFISKQINKMDCKLITKLFNYPNYKIYEFSPRRMHKKPIILFLTRLWDPNNGGSEHGEIISKNRIELIRALKSRFPDNCITGVEESDYSLKLCPDLIINKKLTEKSTYLSIMKRADICIATTGLHKSIGWKFAEYVCASKPIVTEKIEWKLPGDFKKNINYLEFDSPYNCIEKIQYLINNPNIALKMSKENYKYYKKNLRPDKIITNILEKIM